MNKKQKCLKSEMISPYDEDFGTICICAVRYSIGRRTYMPGIVQDFIRPHIRYFSERTLEVMEKDIASAEQMGYGYGDPDIDKPGWIRFLNEIREELSERHE